MSCVNLNGAQQQVNIAVAYHTENCSLPERAFMSHPDAIGAQLQHLQHCEVLKIGNLANFVVKQKRFLQPSQLLQTLHLPQKVKGHIE